MFCKKCGTQLHEQAQFCKKCGTPVTATKPLSAVEQPIAPPPPAAQSPSVAEPTVTPASPLPVKEIAEVKPLPPPLAKPAPPPLPAKEKVAEVKPPSPPPVKAAPPPIAPTEDLKLSPTPAPVERRVESFIASEKIAAAKVADEQSESKSGGKLWLLVAAAGVVVLLAVVFFWWMFSGGEAVKPDQQTASSNSLAPSGMVYVLGGELTMGNDAGEQQERPAHKVAVKAFFIDRNEVTCEEYAKFIAATGRRAPPDWTDGRYPDDAAQRPVTGVDWDDANAYAAWAGKRLPTEQEWEFAARGTDGRRYPWGNEWRPNQANDVSSGLNQTTNVGSFPSGASPFGANDLVGNAWEWTASDYVAYPGGQLPQTELDGNLKVIRGSAFGGDQKHATATFRLGWPMRGAEDYGKTGFRCAKDAEK